MHVCAYACVLFLKELDSIFTRRFTLKDAAFALLFQNIECSSEQFFIGTLKGHSIHIFPRMQLVYSTDSTNEPIRFRPVVNIRSQLFWFPPQHTAPCLDGRIFPLAVSRLAKIVQHNQNVLGREGSANLGVFPQWTIMNDQSLDLLGCVIVQNEFSPQCHLLLTSFQYWLDREEWWECVEFGILIVCCDCDCV